MEHSQMVVPAAARTLLARCDAELVAAQFSTDPTDRFVHAHYAALRMAGAVLESHGRSKVRGQSSNVWELLARYVPELAEWSVRFSASAQIRAALNSGRFDLVDDEKAEAMLCSVEDFRDAAEAHLGLDAFDGPRLEALRAS